MPKKRERNSDEFYRAQLREKDKLIRTLQKRIRELEKQEHLYTETFELFIDEVPPEFENNKCKKCKDGDVVVMDLKHIIIEKCNNCGETKKKKN